MKRESTWKFRGNFQIGVEMRGKFLQTCKNFNSPKNDIKSSLGYFHITEILPMSLNCILKILRETQRKFPRGNFPRDSTGKGGGNIHIGNSPSYPAGKSWGKFHRDDPLEFPHKSALKSGGRGWLARNKKQNNLKQQ